MERFKKSNCRFRETRKNRNPDFSRNRLISGFFMCVSLLANNYFITLVVLTKIYYIAYINLKIYIILNKVTLFYCKVYINTHFFRETYSFYRKGGL